MPYLGKNRISRVGATTTDSLDKGEIMFKISILTVLTVILAMTVFGCAEKNWGRSFQSAKYNQMVNPLAGRDLEPVVGIEGRIGEKVMERHIAGEKSKDGSANPGFGIFTVK